MTFCDGARPMYVDPETRLSRRNAEDWLRHNRLGQQECGWQPRRQ